MSEKLLKSKKIGKESYLGLYQLSEAQHDLRIYADQSCYFVSLVGFTAKTDKQKEDLNELFDEVKTTKQFKDTLEIFWGEQSI